MAYEKPPGQGKKENQNNNENEEDNLYREAINDLDEKSDSTETDNPFQPERRPPRDEDLLVYEILKSMTIEQLKTYKRELNEKAKNLWIKESSLQKKRRSLLTDLTEHMDMLKHHTGLPQVVAHVIEVMTINWPKADEDQTSLSNTAPEMMLQKPKQIISESSSKSLPENDSDKDDKLGMDAIAQGSFAILNNSTKFNVNSIVVKTLDRSTYLLPNAGLMGNYKLKPGDLIALNKSNRLIVDILPAIHDDRVKVMELEERPKCDYNEIGGLEKQIDKIKEAVVYPIIKKEMFKKIGLVPCKGILLHGPPGTGKTMIARTVAAQTNSTFLKMAATSLIQMYIGDGAKIVREAFDLARRKAPTIVFIDEIDAIGLTRNFSDKSGGREVQRTLIELLSQLDGFDSYDDVKLIAATNRMDLLDPALMRSGRLDRKIEIPLPNEIGRAAIMKVHASKLKASNTVDFDELARSTQKFNGAQCRAVVMEAGMIALRKTQKIIEHQDFVEAIQEVLSIKKISNIQMYA